MATITARPRQPFPRTYRGLALTAVAFTALGAASGWTIGHQTRGERPITAVVQPAPQQVMTTGAANVAVGAPADLPATGSSAVAASLPRPGQGAISVVLVRSTRDATDLEAQLSASANLSPWQVAPPQVIVAPDDAAADLARGQFDRASVERAAHGLSPIQVTDLRPAEPEFVPSAVSRSRDASTVFLVHSPEQADSLAAWLAQGSFGVPAGAPANAAVILAPSAEEAAFARAALLQSRGPTGITPVVVDVPARP